MSHTSFSGNNSPENLLGAGCELICIPKVSFYERKSAAAEWYLKYNNTDLCLIKDHKNRAYFYKLISANQFVWDWEITSNLTAQVESDQFMYIENGGQMFGLYFDNYEELTTFHEQTDKIIKRINRRPKTINSLLVTKSNKKHSPTSKNDAHVNANTCIQNRPLPSIPCGNEKAFGKRENMSSSSSNISNEYLSMRPSQATTKVNTRTNISMTPKDSLLFDHKKSPIDRVAYQPMIPQDPSNKNSRKGRNSYGQSNFDRNPNPNNMYSNDYLSIRSCEISNNDSEDTYLPVVVKDSPDLSEYPDGSRKHVMTDKKNPNVTKRPLPKLPSQQKMPTSSLNAKPNNKSLPPIPNTKNQGSDLSTGVGRSLLKTDNNNNFGNRQLPDMNSQINSVQLKSVVKVNSNQSNVKSELTSKPPQVKNKPIMNVTESRSNPPQFSALSKPTNNFGNSVHENRNIPAKPLDMMSEIKKGVHLRPVNKIPEKPKEYSGVSDLLGQALRQTLNSRFVSVNGGDDEDQSDSGDEFNNTDDW